MIRWFSEYDVWQMIEKIFHFITFLIAIASFHQYLYNKSPKYYFIIKRFLQYWKDTKWNITLMCTINEDDRIFENIQDTIIKNFGDFRRSFNLKNKKQYEFGNYIMLVQHDLDCSNNGTVELEIMFKNMNVTYKNASKRLEELRNFFMGLETKLDIKYKNYNMDIFFSDMSNPFFGLMIQRLGEEKISEFQCVFPIAAIETGEQCNEEKYLQVFKNKISLNEEEFYNIEKVARKCLLLE